MKFSWLAVSGPGVNRMCTWSGKTKRVYVTGIDAKFAGNAPLSGCEFPATAKLHDEPPAEGDVYTFIVFEATKIEQ